MELHADRAAAATALRAVFRPAATARFEQALTRVVALAPGEEAGPSRLGGAPDLGPGLVWPIRAAAPGFDAEGVGGPSHAAFIRDRLKQDMPFTFLAQIDCAALAALVEDAQFPSQGRLLFFADLATAPWRDGAPGLRVIWDQAPFAQTSPAPIPQPLVERDAAERDEWARVMGGAPPAGTLSVLRARPVRLNAAWRIPDRGAIEAAALRAVADDEVDEVWSDAIAGYRNGWRWIQVYGSPICEQHDPRYSVAGRGLLGERPSSEAWRARFDEIAREAGQWRVMLQLPVEAVTEGRDAEGVYYVLMRARDIAARAFDRAEIVYQQT